MQLSTYTLFLGETTDLFLKLANLYKQFIDFLLFLPKYFDKMLVDGERYFKLSFIELFFPDVLNMFKPRWIIIYLIDTLLNGFQFSELSSILDCIMMMNHAMLFFWNINDH